MLQNTSLKNDFDCAIVALGNNEARSKWHNELVSLGYHIPSLISNLAYVSPDAKISSGCIIRQFCAVGRNVTLGQATFLNLGAKVHHDCTIGEYSHLLVGAVARGSVSLPAYSWLNANEVRQ